MIAAQEQYVRVSKYRYDSIIDWLTDYLDLYPRLLYHCRRLAKTVPDETLPTLLRPPIRWTHVVIMLNSNLDVTKWADEIVARQLTASAMMDEIHSGIENQRPGSGRPPAVPGSLPVALRQLEQTIVRTANKLEKSLFSDRFDLVEAACATPPDLVTDELRAALIDRRDELIALAKFINENAERMAQGIARFDAVLKRRQEDSVCQARPTQIFRKRPSLSSSLNAETATSHESAGG